jgi:hypothetical protein
MFSERILVLIQFIILCGLLVQDIVLRKEKGNLVSILFYSFLLFTVTGQNLYVLSVMEGGEIPLNLFGHTISEQGFKIATLLVTLSIMIMAFISEYSEVQRPQQHLTSRRRYKVEKPLNPTYYVIVYTITLTAIAWLIAVLGGIQALLFSPGQMVGGQVLPLILMQIAKFPITYKIINKLKIDRLDVWIFVPYIIVTMLNSRRQSIVPLLQLIIAYHYYCNRIKLSKLVFAAIPVFLIVFVYGFYRDFNNFYTEYTWSNFLEFYDKNSFFESFYRLQVEGFSGLAGIISYDLTNSISYDFGLSNLKVIIQLLPYEIRNSAFKDLAETVYNVYPYQGSVVPTGYEAAFANFGILGVLALSLLCGTLVNRMHLYLMRGTKMSDAKSMIIIFSSVNLNLFIGGALWNFLYWFLADVLNSVIHQKVFQFTNKFSNASLKQPLLLGSNTEVSSLTIIPEDEKFVEPSEKSRSAKLISKLLNTSKNSKIVKQISKLLIASKDSTTIKKISKILKPSKNNNNITKLDRRSKQTKAPPEPNDPHGIEQLKESLKNLFDKSNDS